MSCSLNGLKGVIWGISQGSIRRLIKGILRV